MVLFNFKTRFFALMAALILNGCQDNILVTPHEGDVVFKVNAVVGSDSFLIEAGKNHYYMYSDYQLKDSILQFIGKFETTSKCDNDCKEAISFHFADYDYFAPLIPFEASLSIPLGDWDYNTASTSSPLIDTLWILHIEASANGGKPPYQHIFQYNNTTISGVNYLIDTFQNIHNNSRNLILNSFDSQGKVALKYVTTTSITTDAFLLDFRYSVGQNVLTLMTNDSMSLYSTIWFLDSMSLGQGNFLSIEVSNFPNVFTIYMVGTDSFSQSVVAKTFYKVSNNQWSAFENKIVPTITSFSKNISYERFSKVAVRYVSPEGVVYTSEAGKQEKSRFEILNISPYIENEIGLATYKMQVSFNCFVYDKDGNAIEIKNGKGTIAVGVPK